MTNPQHFDPTRPERTATAPYNFVALPENVAGAPDVLVPHDQYHTELRHTGTIECTLTTSSPLFTRCGINIGPQDLDKLAKDLPDFFQNPATLEPMIPGSSLRGMIRTLVEIAGHAKMVGVTDRQLFFRTMDDSNVGKTYGARTRDKIAGGILRTDGNSYWIEKCIVGRVNRSELAETLGKRDWLELYNARNPRDPNMTPKWEYQHKKIGVTPHPQSEEKFEHFRTVQDIEATHSGQTTKEGTLVLTGNIRGKKNEFVFIQGSYGRVDVDENLIRRFHDDDQISQWQGKAFPVGKPNRKRPKNGGLRDGEPIFYLCDEDNQLVFFGRASKFRLPYTQSPTKMLPAYLTSRKAEDIDIAEAIFGYVDLEERQNGNSRKSVARAGRVFFSDARLISDAQNIWHEEIHPQVLSSPKPTSIQLYLTQKHPDHAKSLHHYDNDPITESTLRGHKLYWHKGDVSLADVKADENQVRRYASQFTKIRPVKSDARFEFTLRFENLSSCELGILLWVLEIASKDEYRLKLGMGKSLGLGSVKIDSTLKLTDRRKRYSSLFNQSAEWETGQYDSSYSANVYKQAIADFSTWLRNSTETGSDIEIEEMPRIRTLLTMLSWKGPDTAKTAYMTELRDDFAKRKVLPRAEVVAGLEAPLEGERPPRQSNNRRDDRRGEQSQTNVPSRRTAYKDEDKPNEERSKKTALDVLSFLNAKKKNDDE